jgi:outer membrane protein assembly factor BamB
VDYDWATVAVDAATGRRLWATRHNTGGDAWDITWDLAVGSVPDEEGTERELVFVAGHMGSTVAYDAASGAKVWEARLSPGPDFRSVAFSPATGEEAPLVHVAGGGLVVTYDARSGQELWRSSFGEKETPFYAWSVVASEGRVFVTGWGATVFDLNEGIELEGVTAAYDARSGERLWQTISGAPDIDDFFWDVAASPSGDRVYSTGRSSAGTSTAVTAAYDAATGAQVWLARYAGLTGANAVSDSLTVHPDGAEVYVAASSTADPFTTVAYDALTGTTRWEARYTSPGLGYSYRLAPSPDGSRLFVTGAQSGDFLTVAYDL